MAKTPRLFSSEQMRSVVIASTMLGLLLVALALAQWFAVATRGAGQGFVSNPLVKRAIRDLEPIPLVTHAIGDLELGVPDGWQRMENPNQELTDTLAIFTNPDRYDHQLRIASHRRSAPATPLDVFQQTVVQLRGNEPAGRNIWESDSVRHGLMIGTHYIGRLPSPTGQVRHHICILTEDAQRYWVLDLSEPDDQANVIRIIEHAQMMAQICRSATDHGLIMAEPAGLARAEIWFEGPTSLRSRIPIDWDPGQPISYIPTGGYSRGGGPSGGGGGGSSLWLIRVRAIPVTTGTDRDDPLWPATLLAEQFQHFVGRAPSGNEIYESSQSGVRTWCVLPNRQSKEAFSRQLWYVHMHENKALLIEVLADAPATHIQEDLVASLIEAAVSTDPEEETWSAPRAIDTALDRGAGIVQRQRAELSSAHSEWIYHLIEGPKWVGAVGFVIERILPAPPGLDVRGQSKAVILSRKRVTLDQQWSTSWDGSRYWMSFQRSDGQPDGSAFQEVMTKEMTVNEASLNMSIHTQAGDQTWTAALRPGYVLPACEDHWPIDSHDLPALIWLSRNHLPPQPCWLTAAPDTQDSNAQRVRIRPMMSMDADVATLDENRRVIEYRWADRGNQTIARAQGTRRVERGALLDHFPQMADELERLYQDLNYDD